MNDHAHIWIEMPSDGSMAYFDKRGDGKALVWFVGKVFSCDRCNGYLFLPDNRRYAAVECDIDRKLSENPKQILGAL